MMFQWLTVKKKEQTPAEIQLEKIKELLFPKLELHQQLDETGTLIKFHVDHSVDTNLDAALVDLQDGNNDLTTQQTIGEVVKKLIEVRRYLEAYASFDPEAKYIIVDNPKNNQDILEVD